LTQKALSAPRSPGKRAQCRKGERRPCCGLNEVQLLSDGSLSIFHAAAGGQGDAGRARGQHPSETWDPNEIVLVCRYARCSPIHLLRSRATRGSAKYPIEISLAREGDDNRPEINPQMNRALSLSRFARQTRALDR